MLGWQVRHGNGREEIVYEGPAVQKISMRQDRNYPVDTGDFADRGRGKGAGFNLNIPLPPGTGHIGYLSAMERIVIPQIQAFKPDVIALPVAMTRPRLTHWAGCWQRRKHFR